MATRREPKKKKPVKKGAEEAEVIPFNPAIDSGMLTDSAAVSNNESHTNATPVEPSPSDTGSGFDSGHSGGGDAGGGGGGTTND